MSHAISPVAVDSLRLLRRMTRSEVIAHAGRLASQPWVCQSIRDNQSVNPITVLGRFDVLLSVKSDQYWPTVLVHGTRKAREHIAPQRPYYVFVYVDEQKRPQALSTELSGIPWSLYSGWHEPEGSITVGELPIPSQWQIGPQGPDAELHRSTVDADQPS